MARGGSAAVALSINDAEYQYVRGQARTTFPALLAEFEARSELVVRAEACLLDVRYGAHARQTFDFFPAPGCPEGTLVYFHAGYWQTRDKSTFRFIAPALTREGLNVALVNYPLCPTVSLADLIEAARDSIPAVLRQAAPTADSEHVLIAAGHSAGGHIAVELALTPWSSRRLALSPIDGVIALSGVFDLEPLVATSLNAKLGLDTGRAAVHSPLHRCVPTLPPALFAVGAAETPAFVEQCRRMDEAWRDSGNSSEMHLAEGADHFSLLQHFVSRDTLLFSAVRDLVSRARRRRLDQSH